MGGFGTSFKEKEKNVINEINTQPQQQNQGIGAFGFEMPVELEGGQNKEIAPEEKIGNDWVMDEDTKQKTKAEIEEEHYQKTVKAFEVVNHDKDFLDGIKAYKEEQRQRALKEYQEKVVDMKDTAKMSEKKTVFGKAYSEKTRKKNAAIDRAKMLTNKATSLTYSAQKHINKVNQRFDLKRLEKEQEKKLREEQKDKDKELTAEQIEQAKFQAKGILKAKAFQSLMEAQGTILHEKAFERNMLRDKFDHYYSLVKSFEFLDGEGDAITGVFKDTLEELRPFISLLKTRLIVFVEQNRVRLDGTILGEKDEPAVMHQKDLNAWKELFRSKEDQQINDNDRLKSREKKEEKGLAQALPYGKLVKLTKEEAMNTESDLKSQKKRDELRDLNLKLYDLGQKDLAKTINEYVVGTRYAVGYTEERERLMKAIKAVDKAASKQQDGPVVQILADMKEYFEKMTKGSLEIPAGAEILECHDSQMENEGKNRGMKRNAIITKGTYWSNQKDTPLFAHEPVVNDLKQRMVSNCFMMAGTAGIINVDPALIKSCLKDMGDGTVVVRLYDVDHAEEGEQPKPVYIRVKKTVPRIIGGSADALSAGTLWMQMIEKAFAFYGRKIDGQTVRGYRSLWYGVGANYIKQLLGVGMTACKSSLDKEGQKEFYEELKNIKTTKRVYSTGSNNEPGKGIQSGHAYTILGAQEINGVQYVKMRNPYSNHSLQYDEKGKKSQTGSSVITFANGSDDTYGQFLIKYDDFFKEFNAIYVTDLSKLSEQNQNQNRNQNQE